MMRAHGWIAGVGLLTAGACGSSDLQPGPVDGDFKSQINLAAMLPPSADLVGVTVSPEGKRYVLDRASGLYEVNGTRATLVYGAPTGIELTDVVALGNERFAVTAENDGFMLDLHNQSFTSYFCYLPALVPGSVPTVSQTLRSQGIEVKERTESVAFNDQTLELFAQPQTIRLDTGEVVGSELFIFAEGGGQPIRVQSTGNLAFIAGGMVTVDRTMLLLGWGHEIYGLIDGSAAPTLEKTLTDTSIDISGLALDTDGDLLVLDRAGRRLLEMY
jgi:hypothetical protein